MVSHPLPSARSDRIHSRLKVWNMMCLKQVSCRMLIVGPVPDISNDPSARGRQTADSAREDIGESSLSGFTRDRQRDPEWRSSLFTMQRPKRPEARYPDLVFLQIRRSPPASIAPRPLDGFLTFSVCCDLAHRLRVEDTFESRLRWPGLFARVARDEYPASRTSQTLYHFACLRLGQRINMASP